MGDFTAKVICYTPTLEELKGLLLLKCKRTRWIPTFREVEDGKLNLYERHGNKFLAYGIVHNMEASYKIQCPIKYLSNGHKRKN